MKYIVTEVQVLESGQAVTVTTAHETDREALSKYYQVLSYATQSGLPCHSAVVFTEEGQFIRRDFFRNETKEESDSEIMVEEEAEPDDDNS